MCPEKGVHINPISTQNQATLLAFVYQHTPKVNKTKNTPPTLFTYARTQIPLHGTFVNQNKGMWTEHNF